MKPVNTQYPGGCFLQFECGARLPTHGYLRQSFNWFNPQRREDGHGRLVVYHNREIVSRPKMPDFSEAPCIRCPKRMTSGMETHRMKPVDELRRKKFEDSRIQDRWNLWDEYITCYPREICEEKVWCTIVDDGELIHVVGKFLAEEDEWGTWCGKRAVGESRVAKKKSEITCKECRRELGLR